MRTIVLIRLIALGLICYGCANEEAEPTIPVLTTLEAENVSQISASTGGNITSDGKLEVTERGVCWSDKSLPTTSDNKIIQGSGTGSFHVNISDLLGGKTYYARAFATNKAGTAYGNEIEFSTQTPSVQQVCAGLEYSMVLKSDGSVWVWGANQRNQLGDGTDSDRSRPILFGTGFTRISSTHSTTLALKADGTVWGCGSNPYQQLGFGDVHIASPKQVAAGFSEISAGTFHVLALKPDGTLWAWGHNSEGQLGDGTNMASDSPKLIGSDFVSIAAGAQSSMALKADGTLWTWGDNWHGQLGDGTFEDKNKPTLIGDSFVKISCSWTHSLAIKNDGSLLAWGSNFNGQIGDGTIQKRNTPITIGTNYRSISAGTDFSLAIKADGTLWAWGTNNWGELGTGKALHLDNPSSPYDQLDPALVGSGYREVSAGGGHSLAIKDDLSLWIWGSNTHGQLGDGKIGHQFSSFNPTQLIWE